MGNNDRTSHGGNKPNSGSRNMSRHEMATVLYPGDHKRPHDKMDDVLPAARALAEKKTREQISPAVINGSRTEAYDTYTKRGGSRAWRNNNPGNLEYRGQKGAIGREKAGRFAKFASEEDGMNALKETLRTTYKDRPAASLAEKYAPKTDGNDPVAYTRFLAQHGVDLKKTVGQQVDAVAEAIKKQEGWIPGVIEK
jgi:hypothetical protein